MRGERSLVAFLTGGVIPWLAHGMGMGWDGYSGCFYFGSTDKG